MIGGTGPALHAPMDQGTDAWFDAICSVSTILTVMCLLQISLIGSAGSADLPVAVQQWHWLASVPSGPVLVLTTYTSLLLTFRTGIKRIAISIDTEQDASTADQDEVEAGSEPDCEILDRTSARLSLNSSRGLIVQALTLCESPLLFGRLYRFRSDCKIGDPILTT